MNRISGILICAALFHFFLLFFRFHNEIKHLCLSINVSVARLLCVCCARLNVLNVACQCYNL